MQHSTITLTLDTYGHLIAGAAVAAITHTADKTAVPRVLAATGTDGACIPFVSREDAKGLVDAARPCGVEGSETLLDESV